MWSWAWATTSIFGAYATLWARPDIAQEPRFAESEARSRNSEEFDALFIEWLMQHTKREIFALCQAHKVMCAPVLSFGELMEDPQLKARGYLHPNGAPAKSDEMPELGAPVKMSETPWRDGRPAPLLGQHTEGISAGFFGYSGQEGWWVERPGW